MRGSPQLFQTTLSTGKS